jgi:hypothetical protein
LAGGVPVQEARWWALAGGVHWFVKVAGEAFRPALAGMAFATRQNGPRGKDQTVSWCRWQLRFRMLADDLCHCVMCCGESHGRSSSFAYLAKPYANHPIRAVTE